ncbi:MAG: SUMF1/EgtB/PvdO family nonheme iron enzyme [Candidatus Sumerlaeia bacterium]|nr:SUMF1/EgtB/PvdO family nonheme iron enzyme [Candidatus Sumerlaeia bacterium]
MASHGFVATDTIRPFRPGRSPRLLRFLPILALILMLTAPQGTLAQEAHVTKAGIAAGTNSVEDGHHPVTDIERHAFRDYIRLFYLTLLDREPEPGALDAWLNGYDRMVEMNLDVRFLFRDIGRVFIFSEEYQNRNRSDEMFIRDCYAAFMERVPTEQEINSWLNSTWTRGPVLSTFTESVEFENRVLYIFPGREGIAVNNFVSTMYTGVLDRFLDPAGLEYWTDEFLNSSDVRQRAREMFFDLTESEEYLAKDPTAADYVTSLYRSFMGRFPTTNEVDYWSGEIFHKRQSLDEVVEFFSNSQEFTDRLFEYGLLTPPQELNITLPGNIYLTMVRIPAGEFVMGSPDDERGRFSNEGPQTNVTLTQDFYMGKYPVTQTQWQALMGSNPSYFSNRLINPVEMVSWHDAQAFITALNAHISATGQGPAAMRLPTEAEWEYAARGGTTTRFYFGDSLDCNDLHQDCAAGSIPGNRSDFMWWAGNSNGRTQPVGLMRPNAFGLHDMHGNVWEWCEDRYFDSLAGGSVTDPTGPSSGSYRVRRGGSWFHDAWDSRSANRTGSPPSSRGNTFGFRLAAMDIVERPDPTISIISPDSNFTVPNSTTFVSFSGTATAPESTVSLVQWRRNGGPWQTVDGTSSWSFNANFLVVGINHIDVRATSSDGFFSPLATRTIRRDPPHPTISITTPESNLIIPYAITSVSFAGRASAPSSSVSMVQWRRNGGSWQTADRTISWSFAVTGLAVGETLIEVRATNANGFHSDIVTRTITRQDGMGTGEEVTIMLPGNVPLVVVPIQAGSFIMGSPDDERGRTYYEGPQTNVTLTQDYYMGKYTVTQMQWAAVMGEEWPPPAQPGAPITPFVNITWNETQDFITELNAHIISTDQGPMVMRLPTEAEWEYAARAGTTTRFYFGDSLGCNDSWQDCTAGSLPGNRSDYMWWSGNTNQMQPVGLKLPNPFGLHDMHGNVWELCQDWYTDSLPGGSVTDPAGPSSGFYRVTRGGAWNSPLGECRSAERSVYVPESMWSLVGFRLAADR